MDQTLLEQLKSINWMHTIDLGSGVVTPGKWPRNAYVSAAFDRIDFEGKKVLDVGTCNGLWSFEAEKRGAIEVHSVDFLTHVQYWCSPGYRLAHKALGSCAHYHPDLDVYDVAQLGIRDFDVVVFSGLYYHLKNPLLALARLRAVMKTGGRMVIEGPVLLNQVAAIAKFIYKEHGGDRSNWWIPSEECLRQWIECSRLRIVEEFPSPMPESMNSLGYKVKAIVRRLRGQSELQSRRMVVLAESVSGVDPLYSSIDPDLAEIMSE